MQAKRLYNPFPYDIGCHRVGSDCYEGRQNYNCYCSTRPTKGLAHAAEGALFDPLTDVGRSIKIGRG